MTPIVSGVTFAAAMGEDFVELRGTYNPSAPDAYQIDADAARKLQRLLGSVHRLAADMVRLPDRRSRTCGNC